MRDVIVMGGGLAGIAAARRLGARAVLLEASDGLGGLARTDRVENFCFDWTGHYLHLRTPRWKAEVERLLPGRMRTVERRALIHSCGVFTPFPYQIHTHGLPAHVVAECLKGYVRATLGPEGAALRARQPADAREFILRELGEGFLRHFMEPYNSKLYTVPTRELSAEWGGRFVPRVSLDDVVDGALGLERAGVGYNATFLYPAEGGIEALPRALASELHEVEVHLNAAVRRIDTRARRVHLADGRSFEWKALVATTPLRDLARLLAPCPPDVARAADALRAVSVTSVELGVARPPPLRFHWIYFPEPRFPFYRVGSPSEVSAALAPAGQASYMVEFAHEGPDAQADARIDQAVAGLESAGLFARADVVFARRRVIDTAYVLFDHARAAARQTVLAHLAACGIEPAGRFGLWEYSGMEDALVAGEHAADRILGAF